MSNYEKLSIGHGMGNSAPLGLFFASALRYQNGYPRLRRVNMPLRNPHERVLRVTALAGHLQTHPHSGDPRSPRKTCIAYAPLQEVPHANKSHLLPAHLRSVAAYSVLSWLATTVGHIISRVSPRE